MSKQTAAFVAIGLCSLIVLVKQWLLGDEHEAPWFVWIPILCVLGWSLWQLREKPDPSSKAFDFNPRRGILFFFLGFLIFPLMLGINALFGADISFLNASLVTVGGSLFIGLVGTFTERVGI
ncbi:hypothetical protein [Erythrobacter sp. Dej080120_24]|uniref:hypothetical protein n=1 Tax=Erythrobacter sp. Dej080120_24 TaxID=3024837 RepID=UPI0030C75963